MIQPNKMYNPIVDSETLFYDIDQLQMDEISKESLIEKNPTIFSSSVTMVYTRVEMCVVTNLLVGGVERYALWIVGKEHEMVCLNVYQEISECMDAWFGMLLNVFCTENDPVCFSMFEKDGKTQTVYVGSKCDCCDSSECNTDFH
jgi:hypothetical protein